MTAPGGSAANVDAELGAPEGVADAVAWATAASDGLGLTDSANAVRFARLYGEIARYLTDAERWIFWCGERWELDTAGHHRALALTLGVVREIRREAEEASDEPPEGGGDSPLVRLAKHATASESVARRAATLRAAETLPELQARLTDFDANDRELVCGPDVVTLDRPAPRRPAVTTRPVSHVDRVTRTTRAHYRPEILVGPPPAQVADYLATFLPDEERRRLLFKTLGSCLVGGNAQRLFIIIQGPSTTGKTQLVEALLETLGPDYATAGSASVFRGNLDDRGRPDILKAVARRVAFFSEASQAWELHGDRVKDLTGGGTITARLFRENEYRDVRPAFTPVLVTNVLPRIVGADAALRRRMVVFDFTHTPLVEDPEIRDRFVRSPEVHEWLLARLITGYEEAARDGLADVIVAQGLTTMNAFDNLTHLGSFFRWLTDTDQLTAVDTNAYGVKSTYVPLKSMYDRYALWVKDYGAQRDRAEKLNYDDFNAQLRSSGWRSTKSGVHRWEGWRLSTLLSLYASDA